MLEWDASEEKEDTSLFYLYLTLFAAAIVAVDQWTKALAAAQLTDCVDVIIPGWLELRYLLNAPFSLGFRRVTVDKKC